MADIRITPAIGAVHVTGSAEFRGTGGSSLLFITGSGGIGAGTTDPQSEFHVVSSGTRFFTLERSGTRSWDLGVNSSGTFLITDNTEAADRLAINLSGSVGIGTTNPARALDIVAAPNNGVRIAANNAFIGGGASGGDTQLLYWNGSVAYYGRSSLGGSVTQHEFRTGGATRLLVSGSGQIAFSSYGSGNNTGTAAYNLSVDSSGNIIETANPSLTGTGTANYVTKWSGTNTLTDSTIYDNGANIGIGTSSPTHLLSLERATEAAAYQLNINSAGSISDGNYTGIRFSQASGGTTELGNIKLHYYTTGRTALSMGTRHATQAIFIDNTDAGNVGIGSTAPSAKLNVVGSADVLIVEGSGSTSNTTIMAVDGNNGRLFEVSDDLSDSLFSVNTIAGLPVMEAFADNVVTLGAYNQYDLHITGSRVGIGTSTPDVKLTIKDTQDSSLDSGLGIIRSASSQTGYINMVGGAFNFNAPTGIPIKFRDGGTPNVTILGDGNVGINTESPINKLHVVGSVVAGTTTTLYNSQVSASGYAASFHPNPIYSQQSINMMSFQGNWSDGIGGSDTHFGVGFQYENQLRGGISYDHRGIERMNIWSAYGSIMMYTPSSVTADADPYTAGQSPRLTVAIGGNVGIGTTNPSANLHVGDGSSARNVLIQSNGGGATLRFYDSVNDSSGDRYQYIGHLDTTQRLQFSATGSGAVAMSITPAGSVGIGTTSPGYRFTVDAGAAVAARFQSTADAQIQLYSTDSWAGIQFTDSSDSEYIWYRGATSTFAIGGGGSSVAGKKLHIHGGATVGSGYASHVMPTNGLSVEGGVEVGGDLTVDGIIRAREFHTTFVSASIIYESGSTQFGNSADDTHTFSGSLIVKSYDGNYAIKAEQGDQLNFRNGASAATAYIQYAGPGHTLLGRNLFVEGNSSGSVTGAVRVTSDGKVGIGITNPSATLYISDAANSSTTSFSANGRITMRGDGVLAWGASANQGHLTWDTGKAIIHGLSGQELHLGAGGTLNHMVINTSGNVGINTTSPLQMLHIESGSLLLGRDLGAADYDAINIAYRGSWSGQVNKLAGINVTDSNTLSQTVGRFGVTYNGSVGVFVVTDLYTGGYAQSGDVFRAGGNGTISFPQYGAGYLKTDSNGAILTTTQFTGSFLGDVQGNVTGTAGSETLATVTGRGASTSTAIDLSGTVDQKLTLTATDNSWNYMGFGWSNSGRRHYVGNDSGGRFVFGADNSSYNFYFSGASVGIGTNSPAEELHVFSTGTARIEVEGTDGFAALKATNNSGSYGWYVHDTTDSFRLFDFTDSADRITVNGDGNVGIGTSNPAKKLDVRGGYFITSDGGSNEEAFVQGGNGYAYFGNYGAGKAAFGNSENWTTLIADGGSVGIGTATPSAKLDVRKSYANSSRALIAANTGYGINQQNYDTVVIQQDDVTTLRLVERINGGDDQVMTLTTGDNYSKISTSKQPLQFFVSGSSTGLGYQGLSGNLAMHMALDGNIGVGTSSPAYKLQVNGDLKATGITSTDSISVIHSSGLGFYSGPGSFQSFGSGVSTILLQGTTSNGRAGALWFKGYQGDDVASLYVTDDTQDNYGTTLAAYSGSIRFATQTLAGAKMIINPEGNVGIGTTNPLAKLDIVKTSGDADIVLRGSNSQVLRIDQNSIRTTSNSQLAIFTNNTVTNGVYIAADGKVGIGTNGPVARLDVRDSGTEPVRIYGDTGDTNGLFRIQMDSVSDNFADGARTFLGDGGTDIILGTANSSYTPNNTYISLNHGGRIYMGAGASPDRDFTIETDGNIGIGTIAPQAKLHVNSGIGIFNVTDAWQQGSGGTHLFRASNFSSSINEDSTAIKIYPASNSDRGANKYWGGISFMHLDPENSSWGTGYTGEQFWIGGRLIDQPGQERSALVFATNNNTSAGTHAAEKMVLLPNGNVGIGVTSPSYKLHVEGDAGVGANNAFKARYTTSDNYHGSFRWAGLQLGNNGSNRIIAGRTNTGGYLDFWVNNTNDASDYSVTPDGTRALTLYANATAGFTAGVTAPSFTGSLQGNITGTAASETLQTVTGRGNTSTQQIVLSSIEPQAFTNTGTGTYNKSVLYHSYTYGYMLELAKVTNSNSSDPINFHITARGGGYNPLFITGSTGYVGINDITPSERLDVGGAIRAGGSASSNPDAGAILANYNAGTSINSGELILSTDGKSGWDANVDEMGRIRFWGRDGSGIGARDAAKIVAINETGNGSSTTTFSAGLAFYTSQYNANVAEAMRITNDGKVGIGNTNPVGHLHVNASSDAQIMATADNAISLHQDAAWNSNILFGAYYDGSNQVYGATTRGAFKMVALHDGDSSPQYLAIYGANHGTAGGTITWNTVGFVQDEDGKVGIGTTNPSYALDVLSSDGPTTARFANNDGEDTLVRIIAGNYNTELDARLFLGEADTYGMTLEYDGVNNIGYIGMNSNVDPTGAYSKRMAMPRDNTDTYFPAGNVGINTSSPVAKLETNLNSSNAYDPAVLTTAITAVSNKNSSNVNNQAAGLHLYATGWAGSTTGVISLNAIQIGGNASTADFAIQTRNAGTYAEKFRLTADGNVGIGKTNPDSKLNIISGGKGIHVDKGGHSSTSANLSECRTNYAFAYDTLRNGSTTGFFITNVDANTPAMQAVNSSNAAQNISIQPFGGDVGIGMTAPKYRLDVNDGGAGIQASIGSTYSPGSFAGLHFGYSEPANTNYRKSALVFERTDNHSQGGNASGKIHFLLNNVASYSATSLADSVMVIDTDAVATQGSARVGIGTTTPDAALIVVGSGSASNTTIMAVDGNNGRLFEVSDDLSDSLFSVNTIAGLPVMEAFADNTVVLGAYNQCDLVITGSKVGIGTCAPGYRLHVDNTSFATNSPALYVRNPNSAASGVIAEFVGDSDSIQIKNIGVGDYTIYNTQQSNGIALYDGTGGVEIHYAGSTVLEADSAGGIKVTGQFSATADVIAYSSDERLKENIKPIENAVDKVKQMRGVTFDWNDKSEELGFEPTTKLNDVGVIAQEVEKVFPQLIAHAPFDADTDEEGNVISKSGEDYKTVNYSRLTAVLIEAIKEQQLQIEELREEIKKLKG